MTPTELLTNLIVYPAGFAIVAIGVCLTFAGFGYGLIWVRVWLDDLDASYGGDGSGASQLFWGGLAAILVFAAVLDLFTHYGA